MDPGVPSLLDFAFIPYGFPPPQIGRGSFQGAGKRNYFRLLMQMEMDRSVLDGLVMTQSQIALEILTHRIIEQKAEFDWQLAKLRMNYTNAVLLAEL